MKVKFSGLAREDQESLEYFGLSYSLVEVSFTSLINDDKLINQVREGLKEDHVQALKERLLRGVELPVIIVDDKLRILNGNHRAAALRSMNGSTPKSIMVCKVTSNMDMRQREALQTRLNPTLGLNMTDEEKGVQIEREHKAGYKPKEIAERLDVADSLVEKKLVELNSRRNLAEFGYSKNAAYAGVRKELSRNGNKRIAVDSYMALEPAIAKGDLTVGMAVEGLKDSRKAKDDNEIQAIWKELEDHVEAQKKPRSATKRRGNEPTDLEVINRIKAVTKTPVSVAKKCQKNEKYNESILELHIWLKEVGIYGAEKV